MKRFSNKTTSYCVEVQKKKAFTLAEILLSLVVIGIVAAIALPTLLGNANERAWATQKKAILSRFSQAIPLLPSVNGYGTLTGDLASFGVGGQVNQQSVTADTAAETFVRDGLSKVLKITNICPVTRSGSGNSATFSSSLSDCGLPDEIETMDGEGTLQLSNLIKFSQFNSNFTNHLEAGQAVTPYQQLDTVAAAFETANGESMLVYYNPKCKADMLEKTDHYIQPKVCANFVYDLNGQKGPNTVGKDIGFLTVLYSSESSVVAPIPASASTFDYTSSTFAAKCKDELDAKVPSAEELASIFTNKNLIFGSESNATLISSTASSRGNYWGIELTGGQAGTIKTTGGTAVLCTKR